MHHRCSIPISQCSHHIKTIFHLKTAWYLHVSGSLTNLMRFCCSCVISDDMCNRLSPGQPVYIFESVKDFSCFDSTRGISGWITIWTSEWCTLVWGQKLQWLREMERHKDENSTKISTRCALMPLLNGTRTCSILRRMDAKPHKCSREWNKMSFSIILLLSINMQGSAMHTWKFQTHPVLQWWVRAIESTIFFVCGQLETRARIFRFYSLNQAASQRRTKAFTCSNKLLSLLWEKIQFQLGPTTRSFHTCCRAFWTANWKRFFSSFRSLINNSIG